MPQGKTSRSRVKRRLRRTPNLSSNPLNSGSGLRSFGAMAPLSRYELNQFSFSGSADIYDGAGFLLTNLVDGITQGDTDQQRLGDRIQLLNVSVHGYFYNHVGATANALTHYRFWIFQFLADNGVAIPVPSSMLLNSSANAGTTYGTFSFENIDRIGQYRVLYRSGIYSTVGSANIAVTGSAGGPGIETPFEFSIPLGRADRNITYFTAGVTGPNHIYMLVTTDQATIATNPTVFYGVRVRYIG